MSHHASTPQTVLDAPALSPDPIWIITVMVGKHPNLRRRAVRPAFVGDVERDLLGRTVGVSHKGRKVRRQGRGA